MNKTQNNCNNLDKFISQKNSFVPQIKFKNMHNCTPLLGSYSFLVDTQYTTEILNLSILILTLFDMTC